MKINFAISIVAHHPVRCDRNKFFVHDGDCQAFHFNYLYSIERFIGESSDSVVREIKFLDR